MANNISTTNILTSNVMKVLVAVIVFAVILVPIIDNATKEVVDVEQINTNSSDIDLAYYDLASSGKTSTVNVDIVGENVVFSGDYTKTIPMTDMALMISDKSSAFVKNGQIVYFDGETNTVSDTLTLAVSGNAVNGTGVAWAYFPATDGKYSSFNAGYEYRLSDAVSVGSFAGITAISVENTIQGSNLDGLYAHVQKTEEGVSGVIYDTVQEGA